jgi:DNA-binding response OmpR family regulator
MNEAIVDAMLTSNGNQEHILIVDDDDELRQLLSKYLIKFNYHVDDVVSGSAMWQHLNTATSTRLIILDIMMPNDNGLELLTKLKQMYSDLPILMLSAQGSDVDRTYGLALGAQDYIAKPFYPKELLVRIKNILRYTQPPLMNRASHEFSFAGFDFNSVNNTLIMNNYIQSLTDAESALLRLFCLNPLKILSRDDLIQQLRGFESLHSDRSMDIRVSRLRKKLNNSLLIQTIRFQGYRFNP